MKKQTLTAAAALAAAATTAAPAAAAAEATPPAAAAAAAAPAATVRAYNLNLKVLSVAETVNSNGKPLIKSKVALTIRGRETTRTLMAQGAAADAVRAVLVEGQDAKVRCLFERVQNDNGEVGGEFLTAVGVPLEKAA